MPVGFRPIPVRSEHRHEKQAPGALFGPIFEPTDLQLNFSPRTDPFHSLGPKTHARGFSAESGSVGALARKRAPVACSGPLLCQST